MGWTVHPEEVPCPSCGRVVSAFSPARYASVQGWCEHGHALFWAGAWFEHERSRS